MASRFSRASAVGLILALALVFQGCAAPLHLAWEKDSKFDARPSRVVGETKNLSVRCSSVSETRALLAAEFVSATHYEREVTSRHGRHVAFRGYPWTLAIISWIFVYGASDSQAEQVADTSADSVAPDDGSGGLLLLTFLSAFVVTFSGAGVCADIVWLLLSIPPVIREGIVDDPGEDSTRVLTYSLERVSPCISLTLSDPATGASLKLNWIPQSGATLDAGTLRDAGFRSAELEASSAGLRARVTLPADFARTLEGD